MTTVTIPKELARQGELVVIPRKEYQELLRAKIAKVEEIELTLRQKRSIAAARRRIARGDFLTLNELKEKLGIKN